MTFLIERGARTRQRQVKDSRALIRTRAEAVFGLRTKEEHSGNSSSTHGADPDDGVADRLSSENSLTSAPSVRQSDTPIQQPRSNVRTQGASSSPITGEYTVNGLRNAA